MPPWMTPTPHWPSSSQPTVINLCLLSIVLFIIWANIKRSLTRLFMSSSVLLCQPNVTSSTGFSTWGIWRGRGWWHRQRRGTVIELYVMLCPCVKTLQIFVWRLCIIVWRLHIFIYLCLVVLKLYVLLYKSVVWPILESAKIRIIYIKN
jgi:hypothetical protein